MRKLRFPLLKVNIYYIKKRNTMTNKLNYEEEQIILPILMKLFMKTNSLKSITASRIVEGMNNIRIRDGKFHSKFSEVKLRKLVNYIRSNGLLPLIADSRGYYVDDSCIEEQIQSLKNRQKALQSAIDGLEEYKAQRNLITKNDPFGITDWK